MDTYKDRFPEDLIANAPEGWRILLIALLIKMNATASRHGIYEGSTDYPVVTQFEEVYGELRIQLECDYEPLKSDVLALVNKCSEYSNHTCSKCGQQKPVTRRRVTYENTLRSA